MTAKAPACVICGDTPKNPYTEHPLCTTCAPLISEFRAMTPEQRTWKWCRLLRASRCLLVAAKGFQALTDAPPAKLGNPNSA